MMKKIVLLLAFTCITLIAGAQNTKVGFFALEKPWKSGKPVASAWDFLSAAASLDVKYLPEKRFKKLDKYDVVWLHITDTTLAEDHFEKESLNQLRTYVENGGTLLLTREAFLLIYQLGLEPQKPETIIKQASDNGYGRMLGFHAFRRHPVFQGLNGGAYVVKPSGDIRVRNHGYFEDNVPENGKVVATDWDYIFLRENKKLVLEYEFGAGKVLAVGAYMYFELPPKSKAKAGEAYNVNRQHLEKFTLNCVRYLAGNMQGQQVFYWNFDEPVFKPFASEKLKYFPSMQHQKPAHDWQTETSEIAMAKRFASGNYWDVAGERLLVMGKEKGGIDEVWAHPFMAFRDYEVGIRFSYHDSILWLNDQSPMVTVNPESFARLYKFRRAYLEEIVTVSPDRPQGVIHYEYRGVYPAELFIRFKSNQRIMWPYSHQVLGGMKYDFHDELNAFVITDPSEDFITMLGFNKETQPVYFNGSPLLPSFKKARNPIGHFGEISPSDSVWYGKPTDEYIISGMTKIELEMNDNLDVIFAAGKEDPAKLMSAYDAARNNPERIYRKALEYQQKNQNRFLTITTPDSVFNRAYRWAVAGSDRFFVTTPGLGSSIVAGYGTTAKGWDGEHEINGRPGYSWYFGRDAVWSAFAFLHYGDFGKVKAILEILQDYQDLNGKIFHELSTSGFVHYDASDATPLYVILMGRYLKHSGDLEFVSESLPHIEAAMDFMYSTDTDNDGLIENTNVGHGWVEGGGLFGSHTSLYLAGCWAEALQQAAEIYKVAGNETLSNKYTEDAQKVTESINTKYWNEEEQYFHHGFRKDQSFITEKSIMPSIPILFGDVDNKKAAAVTPVYGTNAYTADWGARIISEDSPSFNPRGYHTGSVWPLYTGWVALAEYRTGRDVQGFSHIMNNLLVYDDWALGFIEEVLHGEEYKPAGVCHHQCWSHTMALQPTLEGMLGLQPDAPSNKLEFRPAFPPHWEQVHIENIRVGNHNIELLKTTEDDRIRYTFKKENSDPLQIRFYPKLPAGTELITKSLGGKLQRPGVENIPDFSFTLHKEAFVELKVEDGIGVLPVYENPKPGWKSYGFRVLDDLLDDKIYTIQFEGKPEARETFSVYINGKAPVKVEKAEMISREGNIFTYRVDFPDGDSKYVSRSVKIFLDE